MQYKISVVIPAYNEEKHIKACINSLRNQTYKDDFEIIIVDNNSNDKTAQYAKEMNVKVVSEPKAGVLFARETGTHAAQGDLIIQTDCDTTYPVDWIEKIIKGFNNNPDAVAIIGAFKFVDGPWWGRYFTGLLFGITDIVYRLTNKLIYIPGSNTAFFKKNWHGYNLELDQGGDEVALLKQLKKEGKVMFLKNNAVLTSARRLDKGILYNIFVTFLFYYVFDFTYRKITGRSIVNPFPRIRKES